MSQHPIADNNDNIPFFEGRKEIIQWTMMLIFVVLSWIFAPWWITLFLVIMMVFVVFGRIWKRHQIKQIMNQHKEMNPLSSTAQDSPSSEEAVAASAQEKGQIGMGTMDLVAAAVVADQMFRHHKAKRQGRVKSDDIDAMDALDDELDELDDEMDELDEMDALDDELDELDDEMDAQDDAMDAQDDEMVALNGMISLYDNDADDM